VNIKEIWKDSGRANQTHRLNQIQDHLEAKKLPARGEDTSEGLISLLLSHRRNSESKSREEAQQEIQDLVGDL
jgi:hypothetical protein